MLRGLRPGRIFARQYRGMKQLLLCLASIASWPAPAVAEPCTLQYVVGRNLLSRAHQQDIAIARQKIVFDLRGQRGKGPGDGGLIKGSVNVRYEIENRGPAAEVVIGFPVGRYTDASYPSPDIVSGFVVKGDGVGALVPAGGTQLLAIERAGIKLCERQNGTGMMHDRAGAGYAWYVWRQTFQPGTNKLELQYNLALLADEGQDSDLALDYALSTTAGWGDGKIGVFEVDFKVQGLAGDWEVAAGLPEGSAVRPSRRLHWYVSDLAPKDDLRFRHVKAAEK
jgi:hypothetical protein